MKIVDGKLYTRESNPAYGFNTSAQWVQEGHGPIGSRSPAPNQAYISNHKPEPIPAGMYLMLGDHRDNSNDSHAWGLVPRQNIIGRAFVVFWPPTRIGLLDNMSENPRPAAAGNSPRVLPPQLSQ
jgi:signal peptidase I